MLWGRLLGPPSLPDGLDWLSYLAGEGRGKAEGWKGTEEGRSRPFKSRGAEPCDLQGGTMAYSTRKSLIGLIGKIENYIIKLITIL